MIAYMKIQEWHFRELIDLGNGKKEALIKKRGDFSVRGRCKDGCYGSEP